MGDRIVVADGPELIRRAAAWLATSIADAATQGGGCALALAGGETPRPVYVELASTPRVPWPAVDVFFGDERAVPPDHSDSNYRAAREALLSRVPIPPSQVHRMEAERDLARAAAEYERLLPAQLDVLVLGVGSDGHTASLFPDSPALRERTRRVVPVESPKPPRWRLTITPPVIAAARRVMVIATGANKAAPVAQALHGPPAPEHVPAQLARHGTWFLDHAAAAMLGPGE